MNFLETLVSNSICQFSSNFTNTCFVEMKQPEASNKINATRIAKALYKLQYILDKKFKALKYFVFVWLEEIPKGQKEERLEKMVRVIEYLREKYYARGMKEWGFEKLIKYKQPNIFKGLEMLSDIILAIKRNTISLGLNKIKQIDRLYEKTDIFVHSIDYLFQRSNAQNLLISFSALRFSPPIQKLQAQNEHSLLLDQYFQIQKLTEFKNQYLKPKIQYQNSLTESMNSIMSIDELYQQQAFTPSKTDKSGVSRKKKVNLSVRRNHSKSISLHRTEIGMKIKEPLVVELAARRVENIKIDLERVCAEESNVREEKSSKGVRGLYPDQVVKDLGDIADNLNVFLWQTGTCNKLMKSARLSAFQITSSQMNSTKKKQSTGSILAKSTRYHPNIQDNQKHLCQSFQLKKSSQTNPVRQTSSALGKKIKSNCVDKKILHYQQTPFHPHKPFNASSKLLSFLKNQPHPSSKNPKPASKISSQQNRSKLRNTSHIQIQKLKTPAELSISTHKPKVIRKFSPITLIREKLMNNLK